MAVRRFRITVDGRTFEVEAEEIEAAAMAPKAPVAEPPEPATRPVEAPQPSAPAPIAHGAAVVTAPLPGNVLDVRVKVGDTVSQGQILVILEAMKMENEITAPHTGTVAEVGVAKGASVNVGDVLVVIH